MDLGGQLSLKLQAAADFDRRNFVVTAVNRDAVEILDAWPGEQTGPLALVGPAGTGKTHLAAAWRRRTGARAVVASDMTATTGAWPLGPMLIEDADRIDHDEQFFHLLNASYRAKSCLLITGRTRPATWPVHIQDLRSRLNATPVVELAEPDEQILKGMLLNLFQQRNIRAPDDLIAYLVLRIERSADAAASIVQALDDVSLPEQRGVTRVLATHFLKDKAHDANPAPQP